jgi:glucodextranase-like protein
MAFASGALDRGEGPQKSNEPTLAPLPVPALIAPAADLTRASSTQLSVALPEGLVADTTYVLRIYVNDALVSERPAPAQGRFNVGGIPLEEGSNEIRAALAAGGREGDRSAPVTITRDHIAPVIRISRPMAGGTIYSATETLRGRTEAGATLEVVVEAATTETIEATTSADGRFEAPLTLSMGENAFVLRSEDLAGNRSSTRLVVTRAVSLASIVISVSASELTTAELPATVAVVAQIRDELGAESEGADVIFSVSPPNRGTTTYRTVSSGGVARWPELVISGDQRAAGAWLVTVLARLPSGEELRGDATIIVAELTPAE